MFQFPGLAFVPYEFRNKYPLVILQFLTLQPRPPRGNQSQTLGVTGSKVGFPIRKFLDQSPFAAPQNLSQRTTSFIASQRQGIHQIPLRHLIALIIHAHPSAEAAAPSVQNLNRPGDRALADPSQTPRHPAIQPFRRRTGQPDQSIDPSLIKTILLQMHPTKACGQAGLHGKPPHPDALSHPPRAKTQSKQHQRPNRSDAFPLHNVKQPADPNPKVFMDRQNFSIGGRQISGLKEPKLRSHSAIRLASAPTEPQGQRPPRPMARQPDKIGGA
jgi:hypothetical protein